MEDCGKRNRNRSRISAQQLVLEVKVSGSKIIDARNQSKYPVEHVEEVYSKPLAYISDWVKDIGLKEYFYLHCAGAYRSMIDGSILKERGQSKVLN